jgi:hypothetical protein
MKKIAALVASAVLVALVATMTFASASQQRPAKKLSWHGLVKAAPAAVESSNNDRDERVVVVERNSVETDIDNPPEGFSQGDEFAASADLYRGGKKVGYDDLHGVVTFMSETQVRFELTATVTVRGSQITVVGSVAFSEDESSSEISLPVVGGTGRYDDVGGELTVVEQRNAARLVFDLKHLD